MDRVNRVIPIIWTFFISVMFRAKVGDVSVTLRRHLCKARSIRICNAVDRHRLLVTIRKNLFS